LKIKKPIFIIAPSRSGSTIFYDLFTRHKDTSFPEHFADKYWQSPWKFRFIPLMLKQQIIRYKIRPLPHEGKFWRKFHPEDGQYLTENDIVKGEKKYLDSAISAQLKAFHAKRFVDRLHDFCIRLKFTNALYPDAYYIILHRDPKSVISSQYRKMIGDWKNESTGKAKDYGAVIEKFDQNNSKFESCINYYKYYIKARDTDLHIIKERTTEVYYDVFVRNPRKELKRLYDFTELNWYDKLDEEIPETLETSNDEKWKTLPEKEKELLISTFGE
jgi:hypothetical protein